MKETRLIKGFSKKILILGNGPFWAQILYNERSMRMIWIIFQKKILGRQIDILGPKMAHPHNSGSAVRIFLNFAA